MTRFTDCSGKVTLLCDHCRQDLLEGDSVFSLSPGRVGGGYIARDYEKGEIVVCLACASQLTRMVDTRIRGTFSSYLGVGAMVPGPIQTSVPT